MGCLIKLLFALTVVMICYGAFELSIYLRERTPVEMTVGGYSSAGDPPKWVTLKDAQVDWSEAIEAGGDLYVPVRPVGSAAPTGIVLEIRDSKHLALAREAMASRSAPGGFRARPMEERRIDTAPLRGLMGGEWLMGSRVRRRIAQGGAVSKQFVVLRQDASPGLWLPLLSLMGGCLMVRAGFWAAWAVRRPKEAKPYSGPPLRSEQLIAQTREIADEPPRAIKRYGGLRVGRPLWLVREKGDALHAIYLEEENLLTRGRIVWGQIVQANSLLFAPGDDDAPAAVIYSTDPYFDSKPHALSSIAHGLFEIKGAATEPDMARFASILEDELTREMRLAVPGRLTSGREVIYTSIMVRRTDLPGGRLSGEFFPLLVLPGETPATLIAPWEWWSPALVAMWKAPQGMSSPPPQPMSPPPLPR